MIRRRGALAGLAVFALVAPAAAQVTDEDIDSARREVNRIVAESQELGDSVQEAWARQFELDHEITGLEESIRIARLQLAETEARLEEVAVEMYMGSASVASISVLLNASDGGFEAGLGYLREVSAVDQSVVDQLRVFRRELDRQTERLAEASDEQEVVAAELEEMALRLQEDLIEAQRVYDDLVERREEEDRQTTTTTAPPVATTAPPATTTAPPAQSTSTTAPPEGATSTTAGPGQLTSTTAPSEGATSTTAGPGQSTSTTAPPATTTTIAPSPSGACPVGGAVSFTDSWGELRSGGRGHQGVDMIAAKNTPLLAIYEGVITRMSNGDLGGLGLWLQADNGDQFYYAHLDSYGDIAVGRRVPQGHVVGFNGSTGNSPEWMPHLHFEHHPGGGAPVNPYPLVKAICG